jgi:hypothetical protein
MLLALLALGGTARTAHAQDAAPPAETAKESPTNQCVFFRSLYDWTPINNTNLILWASRTQPYHLTLTPPCNGLRFANVIGFSSRTGRLCTMDAVLLDNGPGLPERCLIQQIITLDEDSLQALLAQAPGRAQGRTEGRAGKPASIPPQ